MTLAEAIAAIQKGCKVRNAKGSVFWTEHDQHGTPVLMSEPAGYGRAVKHAVFASEHFRDSQEWAIADGSQENDRPKTAMGPR